MKHYDPLIPPDPEEWLALDEEVRFALVQDYHEQANPEILGIVPHASFHTIIENQLAEATDRVVMANWKRLLAGGLDRHQAIHAMCSALSDTFFLADKRPDANFDIVARYHGGLKRLRPKDWRYTT